MTQTLTKKLTTGEKIDRFLRYLQSGQSLQINGYTWVWVQPDEKSQREGLAIEREDVYFWQNDLSFEAVMRMVNNLTEDQLLQITTSLVLQAYTAKRRTP